MAIETVIIRVALAIVISGLIGYERELNNRPAGFRTHILVCVGATVVSLIQLQLIEDMRDLLVLYPEMADTLKIDSSRIIAQVVTGVGFLGAGTIIFHKGSVKGLTTATTVWTVACIGLAIGLGQYTIAFVAGASVGVANMFLKRVEDKIRFKRHSLRLDIVYQRHSLEQILVFFENQKVKVRDVQGLREDSESQQKVRLLLYFPLMKNQEQLKEQLNDLPFIISVKEKV